MSSLTEKADAPPLQCFSPRLSPPSPASSRLPSAITTDSSSPFISICLITLLHRQIEYILSTCRVWIKVLHLKNILMAQLSRFFLALLFFQSKGRHSKAKFIFSTLRPGSARGTTPGYPGMSVWRIFFKTIKKHACFWVFKGIHRVRGQTRSSEDES